MSEDKKVTLILQFMDGSIVPEWRDLEVFPDGVWEYLQANDELWQFVQNDGEDQQLLESTEDTDIVYRLEYAATVEYEYDRDEITWHEYTYPYIDGTLISKTQVTQEVTLGHTSRSG